MFTLLANTEQFIVINKHSGVSFHSENKQQGLLAAAKEALNLELWPVHRLDKATSGLLLLAKNQVACSELCQLFEQKNIQKYYLALSDSPAKKLKKKQGAIVGDMARTRNGSWKLCQSKNNPAITQCFSYSVAPNRRLFILKPHTGKTHQLRVALKSIGAPILGDTRYGASETNAHRMYLHAYQLHFTLAGVDYTYESLPNDGDFAHAEQFIKEQKIKADQLQWPILPQQSQ